MHISEGVLTGPSVVATNLAGAALVAWGAAAMARFTRQQPQRKPLLGMAGAFVFFVSLIHVPAFGGLTCSHPCGTPLAAVLLGPGVTIGLAACSLLLQALFFAHGGISTLGANTVTLGLMGGGCAWLVFRLSRKAGLSIGTSAGLAGFTGDVMTYVMNIVILGAHFAYVAPHPQFSFWGYARALAIAYLPVQGPLAVGEMLVTGYAMRAIARQRPEVLEELGVVAKRGKRALAAGVAAVGLFVMMMAAGRSYAAMDTAKTAAVTQPQAQATAENYGALDDMTSSMAAKAGTPAHNPYIDMEKYPEIWSSMLMLAGLAVGFILGRWWHLLFAEKRDGTAKRNEGPRQASKA